MSEVYSSEWTEHRARFMGRVKQHEQRVLRAPAVKDEGINIQRQTFGITGYADDSRRALRRRQALEAKMLEKMFARQREARKWQLERNISPAVDISCRDIQIEVCRKSNKHLNDILGRRRSGDVVKPRQVGMFLAKILTLKSLPEIGRRFGGRDHTTVLHACRKLARMEEKLWATLNYESPLKEWVDAAFTQWDEIIKGARNAD